MAWLLRPKKSEAVGEEARSVPPEGTDAPAVVEAVPGPVDGSAAGQSSSVPTENPVSVPGGEAGGKSAEETAEYIEDPKFVALKRELHQEVIAQLDPIAIGKASPEQLRAEVRRQAEILCRSRKDLLTSSEHERLIKEVMDEAFGLGPLEQLLSDPDISDILINGPKMIYIEKKGRLQRTHVTFHDDRHLVQIVQRIAAQIGRRIDEMSPMVDARLADGSRFGAKPLHLQKLVDNQSITQEMVDFLIACVKARANIIISGGTGSGKTTLLNSLSRYIPEDERVATIEDAAELRLQQPHVVRMETRTANLEGLGEITTRDLVRNALRMRPDRILIGECRGAEALDMLQAMNTGHEGSLTTIHANTTRDGVSRLEMMASMAGFDMPIWVIRKQIASAVNIILQVSRLSGGVRKVTRISEITGMEGEVISMQDIFEFRQSGLNSDRVAIGQFAATGIRPSIINRIHSYGIDLSNEMFEKRVLMDCKGRV
jgi:pilus assembly protein CpaF